MIWDSLAAIAVTGFGIAASASVPEDMQLHEKRIFSRDMNDR